MQKYQPDHWQLGSGLPNMGRLSRRTFVAGVSSLGLLAGCWRLPFQRPPEPQRLDRVARIAFLSAVSPTAIAHLVEAFRQGLADHGYVEGQNIAIEWRFAQGTYDRVPTISRKERLA